MSDLFGVEEVVVTDEQAEENFENKLDMTLRQLIEEMIEGAKSKECAPDCDGNCPKGGIYTVFNSNPPQEGDGYPITDKNGKAFEMPVHLSIGVGVGANELSLFFDAAFQEFHNLLMLHSATSREDASIIQDSKETPLFEGLAN